LKIRLEKFVGILTLMVLTLGVAVTASPTELPTKKYLNLAAVKTLIAAAEAEEQRLFLEKADSAPVITLQWAQKKARHAAFYKSPSREGADLLKKGNLDVLTYPEFFPNQGGLPIQVDGQTLGGMAASGAKSEIDEAVVQAALDAFSGKK
jgi:glc operon protein GlcG